MACTHCSAPDHEVDACPTAPKPTAADNLLALLDQSAKRAADATAEAITAARADAPAAPDPPPAAPPAPPAAPDRTAAFNAEVEKLINQGKAGEAMELIQKSTLGPQSAAIAQIAAGLGQTNVNDLERKYGEKFTKRRAAFDAVVKEYGAEGSLSDPRVVEQLWGITYGRDPSYVEDEVKSRLDAANAERQQQIANAPPPLSPIEESLTLPDAMKDLAKEFLDEDPEERAWQIQQINAYGLSTEQYLRQAAKSGDPASTYGIGVGKWRRDIWTKIGGKSRPEPTPAAS